MGDRGRKAGTVLKFCPKCGKNKAVEPGKKNCPVCNTPLEQKI